jgi:hypothetical protein
MTDSSYTMTCSVSQGVFGGFHTSRAARTEIQLPQNVAATTVVGHPKAKRCYGWSYGNPEEFITIVGLRPVDSAQSAVNVGVAYQIKKARSK